MKIKSLLLAFVFAFATTAFGATIQLLSEDFSETEGKGSDIKTTNTGTTQITTSGALETYFPWASTGSNVRTANGAIRFGTTSATGTVTTKSLDFSSAKTIVTAEVKGTQSECPDAVVFEINGVTKSATFTSLMGTVEGEGYETVSVEFSAEEMVEGSYGLTIYSVFETSGEPRFFMNSLTVTQVTQDADAVQLAAPAGIAAEVTYESATVSWEEVENATKYSVIFVNGETETEYETTETSITFENLSAETDYSVKVAAVGNGTTHLNSDYSTAFSFTTEAAPVGVWNVLIDEDLSGVDSGNSTGPYGSGTDIGTSLNWVQDHYLVYKAGGAVRFSKEKEKGYLLTTNITFQALETRITAYVKGWSSTKPDYFAVEINGKVYSNNFPQAVMADDFAEVVIEIPSVTAGTYPAKITYAANETTKDMRFFLDSFKIEQFVSASLTELPAPKTVEATELTPYSVKVNWSAVAGASSYTVTLQKVDEEGNSVGSSIVKTAGNTETSIVVDGLADGVSYNVSVVAVGDDKILSSEATTISITTPIDTYKPVFTITDAAGKAMDAFTAPLTDPIVINASAMVGEEAAEVAVEGAPEGATFVDGVFTWTPDGVEVGTEVTLNFSVTNEGGTYTTSVTITVAEALPLVVGEITVSDIKATGATLSWDAVAKATSYTYDIWRGSSIITNGVDMETFFDFEDVAKGVIPYDVTIEGAYDIYGDNKDFDFEHNIIKFDKVTGTLITKKYPKAVTALSIYIAKNKADTAEGATGNPVTIYASADDGATWVPVETYTIDQLPTKNTFTYNFDVALNYTRFKVEYNKVEMNLGISCVGVAYAGAGAKMFAENQTTTDTSITIPKGLVADSEYFVRVKATNDAGSDNAYQYLRFATEKADSATVIIIQ